jgi:hypothetical protein
LKPKVFKISQNLIARIWKCPLIKEKLIFLLMELKPVSEKQARSRMKWGRPT